MKQLFQYSNLNWIKISPEWIEFLIPITISITCISVIFNKKHSTSFNLLTNLITLFFGLIHGFGFGFYFLQIISKEDAFVALLNFAIGVEVAQLFTVLLMITLNYFITNVVRFNSKKWGIIVSGIILFQAVKLSILNSPF